MITDHIFIPKNGSTAECVGCNQVTQIVAIGLCLICLDALEKKKEITHIGDWGELIKDEVLPFDIESDVVPGEPC